MNKTNKIPPWWDSGGKKQWRGEGEMRLVKSGIGGGCTEGMTKEQRLEEREQSSQLRGKGASGRAEAGAAVLPGVLWKSKLTRVAGLGSEGARRGRAKE